MKRTPMLLATLILLIVAMSVYAEVEFGTIALDAANVDCAKCHPGSPHTLHEEKMEQNLVTCEACHGEALDIAIPQCEKCHYGTIHDVHIGKVKTEDCTYCHGDINTTTTRSSIQRSAHTATAISWMCIRDVRHVTRPRRTS